ncbi:MAG: hypothetical protein QOH42_2162 [Blastocatellia bacterium]|jgi:hypothetical protein|nr:hypothetical protein [Blastocatellia bacterium]
MLSALSAKREQLSINQRLLIWEPLFLLLDPSSSDPSSSCRSDTVGV